MDYIDANHIVDLSVRDFFESEVQTEMDQILRSGSAGYDVSGSAAQPDTLDMDGYTNLAGGPAASAGDNNNGDLVGNFTLYTQNTAPETGEMIWLPTTLDDSLSNLNSTTNGLATNLAGGFSQLSPEKFAIDSHGLLVDPQTGQPVSTVNFVMGNLGLPQQQQQQNQIILQQQQQQPQQPQQPEHNIGNVSLNAQNLNMNVQNMNFGSPTHERQQFLSLTPQQLQQGGIITVQQHTEQPQQQLQQAPGLQVQQQLQNGQTNNGRPYAQTASSLLLSKKHKLEPVARVEPKVYPKPAYSYSCLITMAMKNSRTGCMPVSDIYHFMCENFPYFKTAPDGWKNSVRHNLSLNKCFAKIEKPASANGSSRKGCLWALNPEKEAKMAEEVHKWTKKDPAGIRRSMAKPEELERIEERVNGTSSHHPSIILSEKTACRSSKPPPPAPRPDLKTTIVVKAMSTPLSTATTTVTTVPQVNPKSHTAVDPAAVPVSLIHATGEALFTRDINIADPLLASLDLPDHFMDPLNCELMNLDIPVAISPLSNSNNNPLFAGGLLDSPPVKDGQLANGALNSDSLSQYVQFWSPSRTPVTAFI